MGLLICKLPLIVIVALWKLCRQIWVREFKYRVIGDPLFTGHVREHVFAVQF